MIEIHRNLFVGSQCDCDELMFHLSVCEEDRWKLVHATNEPCHRRLSESASAEIDSASNVLISMNGKHLTLDLIDAPFEVDLPTEIFESSIEFIRDGLAAGDRVLVHCSRGVSRSAGICLLYMHRYTNVLPSGSYAEAARFYGSEIYPAFSAGKAVEHHLRKYWT